MDFGKYKNHLRATLGVTQVSSMALGVWLGRRASEASILESLVIVLAYGTLFSVTLSRIDRLLVSSGEGR